MNVVHGNLLIRASAGSGKTFQLGNRVIGRVANGVDPEKICALTFTRKAAGEFADSVLGKLAKAVLEPGAAKSLADDLGRVGEYFEPVLRTIAQSLPRFTLTTIDSFFTRVVRGFQYELGLTGGRFDLLEGPRAAAARDELLGELLGRALDDGRAADFAHAFRRATAGREGVSVGDGLRRFIDTWHREYVGGEARVWGPDFLATVKVGDWEKHKHALADAARAACNAIPDDLARQADAVMTFIDNVEGYELASGNFPDKNAIAKGVLEAVASETTGDIELKFYKAFTLPAAALQAIGELVRLAAAAEMTAAVERTRAVFAVVAGYDALAESRLRRRGMLGFDDVKRLMGAWRYSEKARLSRELVDFRLDARYEHWLLDEFQDTSRGEWMGLLPLLHEAVGDGDGSLFIVGDRKQAIYGWRGGDVSLFDEVKDTFGDGIELRPMADSWRSCPEVLALVNQVCGDGELIRKMFGIGPERWVWDTHVSAEPLRDPDFAGEARVEVIASDGADLESGGEDDDGGGSPEDPRVLRMITQMRELGVGEKNLTCGVLVRRNEEGRVIAEALRAAGFDVVQDGIREPAKDHPACVAVWQLLRWLANPQDGYAQRVLEMCPLAGILRNDGELRWYEAWERLLAATQVEGFAKVIERIIAPMLPGISEYGRGRLAEMVDALAMFDAGPDAGARAAASWIERLEVPQNPGAAAVQVMTIHKSKGLGFDMVFLPMVPDGRIPETQRFGMAKGDDWITSVPPAWARGFFPEIRAAEEGWAADERYEALCQLYVALTRAKRGLYVYLAAKKKSTDLAAPTLSNWMSQATGGDGHPGVIYQNGDPAWSLACEVRVPVVAAHGQVAMGVAVPRRRRLRPSGVHDAEPFAVPLPVVGSPSGMLFGSEVHACFEGVGWLDDLAPGMLPATDAGRLVAEVLGVDEVARLFTRPSALVGLMREQAVDGITPGGWLSGIIDRMHVHRDFEGGAVVKVEIIDFKTDAVVDADELIRRHAGQMQAYAGVVAMLYPGAEVVAWLVSTGLKRLVGIEVG